MSRGLGDVYKRQIGLLFVAGSIGAYSIGKTAGKKLSGRDEQVT